MSTPRKTLKRPRGASPITPSPRRRTRDHLLQGSPQIIASDHPVEDVIDEVIEDAEEVAEAIDIAAGDAPAAGVDHIIEEEMDANMQSHQLVRFAHRRGRHFLPLNPGIVTC